MSSIRRRGVVSALSAATVLVAALVAGGCHKTVHTYEPIDLAYFDTAPVRLDDTIVIDRPVAQVWAAFESNEAWHTFDIGIAKAQWTSEPPLRSGSTRHVDFSEWMGGGYVDEVFFLWETNQQFAFYMQRGTSALVHSYGELWIVTDLGDGTTQVEFRTAFTLKSTFDDYVASGASRLLNLGYEKVLRNLKHYVEDGAVPPTPPPPPQRTPQDEHPVVK